MYIEVADAFSIKGEIVSNKRIDTGHINQTNHLVFMESNGCEKEYIFQAINTYVFKNPKGMMDNIGNVTKHIRDKIREEGGDPYREVLHFLRAVDDERFYTLSDGTVWRVYNYISNAETYETASDLEVLKKAGTAFGTFQKRLSDFDMETLNVTIPNFHNTEKRIENLFKAIKEDACDRVKFVKNEIAFFEQNREICSTFVNLIKNGKIQQRVTHNDTKYNNILIDKNTKDPLCVIDLDTVMPGLTAYDFGDAIRFAACSSTEDEKDLSKVYINMENYEAFTKGFIGASDGFFTNAEIKHMALGARIITIETASRFLEDYLKGDKYFRTHYQNQNLDRARCQIKLAASMEQNFDDMWAIVEKYK